MSFQAPPTLLQLSVQSLLKDETLAISALQDLPMELFPPLFKEAFNHEQSKVLKAMVKVWPFPCLPLGGLMKMKMPYMKTLHTILFGIDVLLRQKVRPRSYKLRVLDLRPLHKDFWNVWAGDKASASSQEVKRKKKTQVRGPRREAEKPLKVLIDMCLKPTAPDVCLSYLFLWVQGRKDLVQLACKKLKMSTVATQNILKFLELLDLDCMEEVEVCCTWKLSTLADFAPYLGQMRNLRKFLLSHVCVPASMSPEEQGQLVSQFTSQFLKLEFLQELCLDSISFLEGQMDQMLRCLEAPLETLSITDCHLSESDLESLSRCPGIRQLKHLNLSDVLLTNISPEPLRVLLERVAGTLKTLDLENCMIVDAQLCVLLPALSRCTQLTTFNYLKNPISVATLERLLCHTARLSRLSLEMYSTPWEIYGAQGASHHKRLEQLREELNRSIKPLEHTKTVWFSIIPCPPCDNQAI
ncbi:PRAME family member 12 [Phodopus roborovskii]|uniref:Pramef12 protein n=1 Tax=Phodopus roborovskii TaxID=109678 RepID=A0AAV0AAA7_PHORO|nr:PRAME family member 12 [Phodopus roborovskii]CAH7443500.1 Pramef12 [Phodopus roborovskii]